MEDEAEDLSGTAYGAEKDALSDREKIDWIRLIRTEQIGPITFHELIAVFGSAGAALDAIPELSRRGGTNRSRMVFPLELAEREWEAAERAGAKILACPETAYPPMLKHIPASPPLLFARGDPGVAARKTVAIVGSRNASAIGRQFTAELARDLGTAGIIIVSGLARGIDTTAHEASLATGTVGVIAGGIDIVYPPENASLHAAIAERGLLLSECPPGFIPRGRDFPRRNRIISGISSGVVVIEAAKKSGSLITARQALEQNREVFAVPGHPLDPRAIGTNGLIKGGAHIATCAEDIVTELFGAYQRAHGRQEPMRQADLFAASPRSALAERPAGDLEMIVASLSYTPVQPDLLLRQTGLTPRSLTIALLELDLAGRIERYQDESISLKPGAHRAL